MTEKLYYIDSHCHSFTARVLACEPCGDAYEVVLDRSAFFPGGGGQSPDSGWIGTAAVKNMKEKDGVLLHYTAEALEPGAEYSCSIDWEIRFRRMQNHSGEHVVSGLAHNLFGLENVGFHMGEEGMTIDLNGELSEEQLAVLEKKANEAVRENLPVTCSFPAAQVLESLEYRSKLELTENVRIVEVQGVDRCACCAPHVKQTGEIGLIKLLEHTRHRGGVRITMICGMDALDAVNAMQRSVLTVSRLLSAKRGEIDRGVERVLSEQLKNKDRIAALSMALVGRMAEQYEATDGNICVFDSLLEEPALRELVNLLAEKCGGYAAAFSGDDEQGYRYIIGSRHVDLRAAGKNINQGIGGRGGGSTEMIQGRAAKSAKEILSFVSQSNV